MKIAKISSEGVPLYYNEFCGKGEDSCTTSEKGQLNVETGELTINSIKFEDEADYFCQPGPDEDGKTRRIQFGLRLEVFSKSYLYLDLEFGC